ncbi:4-alpha-glucanotransferase [Leptolyngbya sp. FACHB-8]|uniref:4-alpha-glucanotransferase n=1 Tax=unclassified Leptolyngbya TaxID=2650499 RepID=UPI001687F14C|nr:4-alpha-glucanotransferase [Leptolyngbya sp. FACHB-8]MBD1913306.1 4-alpha-glucanotransferase [Leptolyngbya sp. FACHB-8]
MAFPRSSGILLHPTSLPSRFGIGDLGPAAYQFVDFLFENGQQIWQVLPLGPTGHGNSPYMCYSAMAGNPSLISLERLQEKGLLTEDELNSLPEYAAHWVDYDHVIQSKLPLLKQASQRFHDHAELGQRREFDKFCAHNHFWLNDYALFMALKGVFGGKSWHQWDEAIAQRHPEALEHWRVELLNDTFFQKFLQFEFFQQWGDLRAYANDAGIQIMGDIPIYVAHDSVDVWAFPELFHLDPETGAPKLMAGVPPDYFSATGQLWGNPIYRWDRLQETDFEWWVERFRATFQLVDMVRIDHFRGFCAFWAVAQGEETAINGEWLEAPGEIFFKTLQEKMGTLPIIAEDLGVITPDVVALREQFQFPGMKILQFAFGSGPDNHFLPFNHDRNFVVYTGTHDNDTTQGWFQTLPDWEREAFRNYLGCTSDSGIHWDLIRLAMGSVANQAVFPLQDTLGLGTEARMNFPGKAEGNWQWRYPQEALTREVSDRLRFMTQIYGRLPQQPSQRHHRQEAEQHSGHHHG